MNYNTMQMREIMFRGKRLDNGEWIEGHLIRYENGRTRICESKTDIFCYEKDCSIIQTVAHETETLTVGQYTGLNDKYGKRIFEGDIVLGLFHYELAAKGVVTFQDGAFGLRWNRGKVGEFSAFTSICHVAYKVIGNIHDNPELLEEENNETD